MEEWRDVREYEGRYLVSSTGLVKSLKRNKTIRGDGILSPKVCQNFNAKREYVNLIDENGRGRLLPVARIVAMAFIPNEGKKPQVNHKNGNALDNRVENLEWVTASENVKHAITHGLNKVNKPCVLVRVHDHHEMRFLTMRDASAYLGRCIGYVSKKHGLGRYVQDANTGDVYMVRLANECA